VRVAVLSDTHAPRFWKSCPDRVQANVRHADVILHAGDVCIADVLDELAAFAPVLAVKGNNDGDDVAAWGAPAIRRFEIEGLPVAMIHDSGPARGRFARLRRTFPEARLIVFGHSHIPLHETRDDVHIFNPGSPTDRRRQPAGTMGLLEIHRGRLIDVRIVEVTDRRPD
jgi:putative phosphoesterase